MTTRLISLIVVTLFAIGFQSSAFASSDPVTLSGPQSAIDLTHVITKNQTLDETEEISTDLSRYPEGEAYYVDISNDTDEEANRLLIFSYPLLTKSSPIGPSIVKPHVAEILVLSGEASLEILPPGRGNIYGAAQLKIPAGETVRLGFSHEGSIDGVGLFLWQPATFNEFESYRIWSNGVFLGIISILVAFGLGIALVSWTSRTGAQIALLASAWILEYVTLTSEIAGMWRVVGICLFAIATLSYVLAHIEKPKGPLASSRLMLFARVVLALPIGLAFLGLPVSMALARLEGLALGLALLYLVLFRTSAWGQFGASIRFGLRALVFTGALTSLLPLFNWKSGGLVIEPLLHGVFLVSLCLLVFPSILGLRRLERDFASIAHDPEPKESEEISPGPEPLFKGEDRYALGVAASHQGLWDWTIEGDRLYLSASIDGMLGLATGDLDRSELGWAKRVHPDDLDRYRNALRSYIERGNVSFSLEFRMRHQDGSFPWLQLRATCMPGNDGLAERCVGVISDITPTRMLQERLAHHATRDTLTELPNRQVLLDEIKRAIDHAPGGRKPSLLVIDLDRFKTINDGLGHTMGDLLLQILAKRLESTVGTSDTVARIGSDEFGVLLSHGSSDTPGHDSHDTSGLSAEELAEYILDLLAHPVELEGTEIFPTASIGIAPCHDAHEEPEQLLREAELAMFRAKRAGGGRYVMFQEHMGRSSSKALSLETDLRRALQRQQIEVLYQPIMNLTEGSVAGFEALIRWRHASKGLLVPDQFVGIAEETDMIVPLGRFAMSMASLQLAQWQKLYPTTNTLFASVNVSSRQLMRGDFASDVKEVLMNADLEPGTLKLEVTESLIQEDPDLALDLLSKARELGAGICLDDFGTGFASLSNLQKYPFDTIKIDRSFISTMESRSDSSVIVKSIVDLANELGLIVIAEGLETEDDALLLKKMGCMFGQGYVFGAPMTASEAQTFLVHHCK